MTLLQLYKETVSASGARVLLPASHLSEFVFMQVPCRGEPKGRREDLAWIRKYFSPSVPLLQNENQEIQNDRQLKIFLSSMGRTKGSGPYQGQSLPRLTVPPPNRANVPYFPSPQLGFWIVHNFLAWKRASATCRDRAAILHNRVWRTVT